MNLAELTFTLDRAEALAPYKRDVFAAVVAAPCGGHPATVRRLASAIQVSDQQAQKALVALGGWVRRGGPAVPWYGRGPAPRTWAPELEGEVFRPATGLTAEEILALPPGSFWWESNALWGWCWHPFQLRVVAAVYPSRRDDLWDEVRCAVHARMETALEGAPAKLSFGLRGEHRGETTLRARLEGHPNLWGTLLPAPRRKGEP